jgi:hypothetical protein
MTVVKAFLLPRERFYLLIALKSVVVNVCLRALFANQTAEDQKVVFSAATNLVQKFAARGCAHHNTI